MNNIKNNFAYSIIFIPEMLLLILGMSFLLFFIADLTISCVIVFSLLSLLIGFIALYFIGKKQRGKIRMISSAITSIRENEFTSADEVKLDKYLADLEYDIKKMYVKTQSDIKYLKKLEQVRTEFLGNVSHELRTPIFAIQGYIETLLNGAIDDTKVNRAFLKKANHHTLRLNDLLNDLIDISMIESGQMRMSFRYFDICEFLKETVNEFQQLAEEKNLELKFISSKNKLKLYGDRDKLKQVMVNLIQNAIKYTDAGSVVVSVKDEKRFGEICVTDTGFGIAEEDIDRIFERFYRVDKARSRAVGGTGLGLAIVKHILDAHDTTIIVKSKPGEGAKFLFRLKR